MASIIKVRFSGQALGQPLEVTQSLVTTLTTIHTTLSNTTTFDQVYLWATNPASSTNQLNLYFGNSNSGNRIQMGIAPLAGPQLVVPGITLMGSATIQAFVASGTLIISGDVNRIDQS